MFITQTQPLVVVPLGEATVFTIQGPAAQIRRVVVENLDAANTLTYRFQYSDNGSTWTDVAADDSLAPEERVTAELTGHLYFRFRASGDLNIAVKVDTEKDWTDEFITI